MSNLKALILGILILVPILILAFVALFGEHHFNLRTYFPKTDATGEVQYSAEGDTIFHQIPDFSLLSQQGKAFTGADLEGSIYIANFFSTNCPSNCQKIASQLVRVQEAFETKPEVKIVSITADPENDAAETLQQFAAKYGAREDKWHFLKGNRQDVVRLAKEGYFLPVPDEGQQSFTYSDKLVLVDKEGKIRGIYEGTDLAEIDRLITEINVLLDEYSKRK